MKSRMMEEEGSRAVDRLRGLVVLPCSENRDEVNRRWEEHANGVARRCFSPLTQVYEGRITAA